MTLLARAMAEQEGFFRAGTRAARNCNPGNLRPPAGVTLHGQSGLDPQGFAVFPDAAAGWAALDHQIDIDAARGHTLATFLRKYAPAAENDTAKYIAFVALRLGVGAETSLADLRQEVGR
jgi:hypothetical protein